MTLQLLTVEPKIERSPAPGPHRIGLLAHALVASLIPDNHVSGPVLSSGDDTFEVQVLERMVLGVDSQALLGWIQGGPPGNRPGSQHALHFESEIVVKTAGRMFLHYEA